jgi:3-deoxy-D-manno-octulosonic-acid transferase
LKLFYQILIHCTQLILPTFRFISPKLKLFVNGRTQWKQKLAAQVSENDKIIWFHAASLGEYEQAVPLINRLKISHPNHRIAVSFFSPSGYEVKKKDSKLDIITYLPIDTPKNAKAFLDILQPEISFFIKYEIWPNFLDELAKREIKTYLVSGVFREDQLYFKPLGHFMAEALGKFNHIFVQNEDSLQLLKGHHFDNSSLSGDTRYDRVISQLNMDNKLEFMEKFTDSDEPVVVFGSSWPDDESIFLDVIDKASLKIKVVIAPHQIKPAQIQKLKKNLTKKVICYTELEPNNLADFDVLIVDTIGLLTKIYSYADVAYVGGGMGNSGLHNILEPAAFGIPIIIGDNFKNFPEAVSLKKLGGLFSVSNQAEFEKIFEKLITNPTFREKSGQICGHSVNSEAGATQHILDNIEF